MFNQLFLFFSGDLTTDEQTITQGFVSEMASSRGRGMCSALMSGLFASESSMKVVNIGGKSTSNEPAVRKTLFNITFEGSDSESSPAESPEKLLPESPPLKRSKVKFVPDIVLESASKEHLIIEVKKGRLFHEEYIPRLRYMLIPAALHQGTSVGFLICANIAVLEKCIVSNGIVSFQRGVYEFEPDSLVAGMQDLLEDIYCNIV